MSQRSMKKEEEERDRERRGRRQASAIHRDARQRWKSECLMISSEAGRKLERELRRLGSKQQTCGGACGGDVAQHSSSDLTRRAMSE